jgi:hypothetical protein
MRNLLFYNHFCFLLYAVLFIWYATSLLYCIWFAASLLYSVVHTTSYARNPVQRSPPHGRPRHLLINLERAPTLPHITLYPPHRAFVPHSAIHAGQLCSPIRTVAQPLRPRATLHLPRTTLLHPHSTPPVLTVVVITITRRHPCRFAPSLPSPPVPVLTIASASSSPLS